MDLDTPLEPETVPEQQGSAMLQVHEAYEFMGNSRGAQVLIGDDGREGH